MENSEQQESQEPQEPQIKPPLTADAIEASIYKTFTALETKFTLTPASVRGALYSIINRIDRQGD